MTPIFDVIIVGAGSVGVPLSMVLSMRNIRVLVIERGHSIGQGQNKTAIGGIRATHSVPAKIKTSQISLNIFSTWQADYGEDIHWQKGGYCFPAYTSETESNLKGLLKVQKSYGLNIDWLGSKELKNIVPGINTDGLLGGTFSPDDGTASPLMSINAFYNMARKYGAIFKFNERIEKIIMRNGCIYGVKTNKQEYAAPVLANCAGAYARELGKLAEINVPVFPESHEAGVTEPVQPFFKAMVVDLRKTLGVENFYFYQNSGGHIIFCLTPENTISGTNTISTSEFLPIAAQRLAGTVPRLRNVKIRRIWRGLYPMTPDGMPIIDRVREIKGLYMAVGMCGQGFMLGPGAAMILADMIMQSPPSLEPKLLESFSLYRSFESAFEKLK
ncbi:MAG: FAD-binding oxidoreductase [Planctomycetes bacterium]|nr:FAD-binding oxidoreductase [Planctomycetota bacterium]